MAGFESFSIALDKSIDLSDTAQFAIFIRSVDKEFTVTAELLASQPLKGTATEEHIFNEVQKVFTSFGLPWSKLVGIYIDGVPSMVGLHKDFIGILNEKATELNVQKDDLIVLHCIIHQQKVNSTSEWLSVGFLNALLMAAKSLERLAIPVREWKCHLLFYIATVKLPTELKTRFEKRYGNDPRVLPTFDQLVRFLEKECRLLDNIP
ncbi:General transcription factor II-I repeat domain-containing protein 2 [Eumeta japonica]|uniref:General transcription factor II-I repeat domain-containing protein 2 n=1 Tax=Eumeta variegata TaxID=151549 RepID=A0A4C1WSA3_EUMVA|nr:General transcription factor II-I repeat domain-containing protein 2 [Eumeta japonica]